MSAELLAARWDAEYRAGRYAGEPPLPFVARIVTALDAHPGARAGRGLYVGCGNGRNYLPLVDAGLDLVGLDVSSEAMSQIAARRPELGAALVAAHFARVARLLRPGGLFFLRVNSASTEVWHRHTVVERHPLGGFTVRYDEGPKRNLPVHFYSREELLARTAGDFALVAEPREDVVRREPPKTGSWSQWEAIWARRPGRTER